MTRLLTLSLVLFTGIGCDSNNTGNDDSPDGTTGAEGIAKLSVDGLNVDGQLESCKVSVLDDDGNVVASGNTGTTIEVITDDNGEDFIVKLGVPSDVGCDGQFLHNGAFMTLDVDVELVNGDTLNLGTPTGFPYYEWDGRLKCAASDDYGWSYDYNPVGDDVTCVDRKGQLEITGWDVDFTSGMPVIEDCSVSEFSADADGLSLTCTSFDSDTDIVYVDCTVV